MRPSRVIGLVMARNEWPLLKLSISHALAHHVDTVYALDHCSEDGTRDGLAGLKAVWQDRLHVFTLPERGFLQEAVTFILTAMIKATADDWIYPFDADEFGLSGPVPLRDLVRATDPATAVLRYDVQNWLSTHDFDTADLDRYRALRYRAHPTQPSHRYSEPVVRQIESGEISYFDVPFACKVIFRGGLSVWPAAGNHSVQPVAMAERALPPEAFRVAHFPLLSAARLNDRIDKGRQHAANGFPRNHGWQSRMLLRLHEAGTVADFWRRNSIAPAAPANPPHAPDDSFAAAIAVTLDALAAAEAAAVPPTSEQGVPAMPLAAAIEALRQAQEICKTLARERDTLRNSTTGRYLPHLLRLENAARRLKRAVLPVRRSVKQPG